MLPLDQIISGITHDQEGTAEDRAREAIQEYKRIKNTPIVSLKVVVDLPVADDDPEEAISLRPAAQRGKLTIEATGRTMEEAVGAVYATMGRIDGLTFIPSEDPDDGDSEEVSL